MNTIKRLINMLEQHGQPSNFLINLHDVTSQESRLYFLIRDGVVASDQEAVHHLYGDDIGKIPVNYRMLKSRVKKKLFNQLHLLDLQELSSLEPKRMRHECRSLLYRAQLLYSANQPALAEELLDKILVVAKGYELYPMLLNALDIKKDIYYHEREKEKYFLYDEEVKKVETVVRAEREAEDIYKGTRITANSFITNRHEVLSKFGEAIASLGELWEKVKSYLIFEYYYILQVQQYELLGDFDSVIKLSEYAENLVSTGQVNNKLFDHSLNAFLSVYAHLRVGRLDEGLKLAAKTVALFDSKSHNFFAFMENYVILAMHKQDYVLGHTLLQQVNSNIFFSSQTEPAKDRWLIIDAFVNLVINRVIPHDALDKMKDAAYISKDKQGFYVYVNVLEFMYLLLNRSQEDSYESYIDRYRKYAIKYLKNDKVERLKLFYRLMALALRENFNYAKSLRKGQPLFEKLKNTKAPGEAYAEVEVVPFEHLWELTLNIMKEQFQLSGAKI